MRPWRAHRAAILLLFVGLLGVTTLAWGQFANQTGNVVGTVGGACNGSLNDYAWPDTNGDILKCVSSVWTLVTQPATAAGLTGYVQFNNAGALTGSANFFWDNTNNRLGIGTATMASNTALAVNGGEVVGSYAATATAAPSNGLIVSGNVGIGTAAPDAALDVTGGAVTRSSAENHYYNVLSYAAQGGTGTGTVEIMLPAGRYKPSTFVNVFVVIRGYNTRTAGSTATWEVITGAQVRPTGAINAITSATMIGRPPFSSVRWANDTGNNVNAILLGTTSSLWGDTIEVSEVITTGGSSYSGGWGSGWSAQTLASESSLTTTSAAIDMYDSGGKIGIGTISPLDTLDVFGAVAIGTGYAGITAAPTSGLIVQGNVGIGTSSPAYLLHIGSASASGIVEELQNSSGNCTFQPSSSALQVICSSDRRLKEDIDDAVPALPQLADMRVRNYTIKANGERTIGVIAQEMIWKHPDLVHMGPDGYYGVEAPNVWLLVKAIQELKDANDDLTARLSADDDALKSATDSIADLRESFEAYKSAHP